MIKLKDLVGHVAFLAIDIAFICQRIFLKIIYPHFIFIILIFLYLIKIINFFQ